MTDNQQDNRPEPDPLLTPGEVAGLFRVHVQTVRHWAQTGRLCYTRTPGGQYRYHAADVAAILNGGQS